MSRCQIVVASAAFLSAAVAHADGKIGINVVLNQPADESILADLGTHGDVLDLLPEINAVTLRASASELSAIQGLPYVLAANPDVQCDLTDGLDLPDFSNGGNQWSLDAINVTDFGATRTVGYDGEGVYVAVIDDGLPSNWREYFPEERIAGQFARAFSGGGGIHGTVSEQPEAWQHSTTGHGIGVTSVILGIRYAGQFALPEYLNGVAPNATIIPLRTVHTDHGARSSVHTRAILYVTGLKLSGALGSAPVVINMSWGGFDDDAMLRAAIDYAIANGVIAVACAGNASDAGMVFPGRYAPVISVAATGWIGQFPPDDPTTIEWCVRDVPESDVSQHFVPGYSSRELPSQQLDVAAPAHWVPVAARENGQVDYTFFNGTSAACPHVVGIAALMLQKNPNLTQAEIESILTNTATPLAPGCRDVREVGVGPGNPPTWDDHNNVFFFDTTVCWESNATGAGLVQADAALAATPIP